MKMLIAMIATLAFSTSTFATEKQTAKECTFKNQIPATAVVREALSTRGTEILVVLDATLINPENHNDTKKFNGHILMIKNLDGTVREGDDGYAKTTIKGSKVNFELDNDNNELIKSEVTFDKDGKIKTLKYKQKILNSPLDLILPLTVNSIECKF